MPGHSSSSAPNVTNHVLMDLMLVHRSMDMLEKVGYEGQVATYFSTTLDCLDN